MIANLPAAKSVKAPVTQNVWVMSSWMPMPAKDPERPPPRRARCLDSQDFNAEARATATPSPDSSRTRPATRVLVEEGSLYPALYRLERRGWVEAEWGTSELGRRAKLYRLTDAGREQLAAEMATWRRFSAGVSKVLLST